MFLKRNFPLSPLTFKGRLASILLRQYFRLLKARHGADWDFPLPGYEENPMYMSEQELYYTGYKFYCSPHTTADRDSGLENYFAGQDLIFKTPENFIKDSTISLHAGGDLMNYELITPEHTKYLWDEIGPWFFNADIVYANLETPVDITIEPTPVPELLLKGMYFNGSEELFSIFNGQNRYKGYDILSLANNHMLDMGYEGLKNTMKFLRGKGIAFTGGYDERSNVGQPTILERNGIKVAFVNYTYSLNTVKEEPGLEWMCNHIRLNLPGVDLSPVIKQVEYARAQGADIVVAALHTGNCYQAYPSAHTVEIFHRIFDEAGVDIILGSHPHNPQAMEKYRFTDPFSGRMKDGFAIYSLADFVAYDIFSWCRLPILLDIEIAKGTLDNHTETVISSVKVLPVYHCLARNKQLRFTPLKQAAKKQPKWMGQRQRKELKDLNSFFDNFIRPEKMELLEL